MKKERVPRYLHLPALIIWLDVEDIGLLIVMYVLWLIIDSIYVLPFVVLVPYLVHRLKATKPRGFIKHELYKLGINKMPNYPDPTTIKFLE